MLNFELEPKSNGGKIVLSFTDRDPCFHIMIEPVETTAQEAFSL